jgi:hypothetical protein
MPAHHPGIPTSGPGSKIESTIPVRRRGSVGTVPHLSKGPVYTLCLTVLILVSLVVLASPDVPRVAIVLALVVGAGSAGILLGRSIDVEVNGHGLHVAQPQGVERIPAQQLPHEEDQRR